MSISARISPRSALSMTWTTRRRVPRQVGGTDVATTPDGTQPHLLIGGQLHHVAANENAHRKTH